MQKILFTFLFTSFALHAQTSGHATYKLHIQFSEDVLQADSKYGLLKQAVEIAPELRYRLIFNNEKANFNFVQNDRVDQVAANTASSLAGADRLIFIDRQKKSFLMEVKGDKILFEDHEYVVADTLVSDWKITNEEKLISGYLCYKATTIKEVDMGTYIAKQLVTAYFCPKIPVPFGPGLFGGLPGLILELQEKNSAFVLEEIKFRNIEDSEFMIPKGRTVLSRKQYIDVVNKRFETLKELSKQ
ncbi:GLPGLI family protein [Flavobacterium sp.]|uniref:GLPGLI family protein n=1 Tax=Flavobacterium sp. TaxID=239 RepID=UPI002629EFCA|nr:GLPGLI family protein [Flavobacterium sp.]